MAEPDQYVWDNCEALRADGNVELADGVCETYELVTGAITGIDTFFLLFGVSGTNCRRSHCWLALLLFFVFVLVN